MVFVVFGRGGEYSCIRGIKIHLKGQIQFYQGKYSCSWENTVLCEGNRVLFGIHTVLSVAKSVIFWENTVVFLDKTVAFGQKYICTSGKHIFS